MAPTRILILLTVVLSLPLAGAASADTPRRIVSLNLCTDQLLMALVPAQRIASITWLSRSEGDPALLPLARHLPANRGSAEQAVSPPARRARCCAGLVCRCWKWMP
jgi:iron complex transport system substrate-binding protein